MTERVPTHGGNAGLCEHPHTCQACEDGRDEPCADLFSHPMCGVVACAEGGAS